MSLQQQLDFELRQRAALLPQEIVELKALTDKNLQGMGIHQSQITTVKLLLDSLKEQQDEVIESLAPTLPAKEFTEKRGEIEDFLTSTHSIMSVFRYIFSQRNESPHYNLLLDIADLVAAECYIPCIKLSNKWKNLPQDHYREPPLTYLNAMLSPAAITRRHTLSKVGLQLHAELEEQLPISVISLPFHDTVAVWTFCSIYHEVGHLLDNDIGLRKELSAAITAELEKAAPGNQEAAERRVFWEYWVGEMIADAFGVALGGAAFGYAMMNMLFRAPEEIKLLSADKHPNEYVRIFLVIELLRGTKVKALTDAAKEIEDTWRGIYPDIAELAPYVTECKTVAGILLNRKLAALNDHSLIELSPKIEADYKRVDALATWLQFEVDRPEPENYPFRLVPAAAQLAVQRVEEDFAKQYEGIEKRSLAFLSLIKRPKFLDPTGISATRRAYLQDRVKNMKLTKSA
ncbi:MAG TPA: hypothetical protein VM911_16605 [Pyrinomonadaceae bacterium]|jgi:hypothetical protein|nr:hypothetical protein [Pyrinomonadaceae bacterium]